MTERILFAPRFNEGWIPAFAGMTDGLGQAPFKAEGIKYGGF